MIFSPDHSKLMVPGQPRHLMGVQMKLGWNAGMRAEHSKHTEQHTTFPSETKEPDRFHLKYSEAG